MMMIYLCPFCGYQLARALHDGVSDCQHCHRVFTSTHYNRLLAAGWILRRYSHVGHDQFLYMSKLDPEDAEMIYNLVGEEGLSHDELQSHLREIGVSAKLVA